MSTFIIFAFGVFLGITLQPKLNTFFAVETKAQIKAICDKFRCGKNDFTYYLEDEDGYFIVSVKDKEYRIKFSMNKPCQVVFCEQVFRVSGPYE